MGSKRSEEVTLLWKLVVRGGLVCLVLFGLYGMAISRWAGVNLRLSSDTIRYDKENHQVQYGSVTLINPSVHEVQLKVQPSCGCVVVLNYPKRTVPFLPYVVNLELHADALIAKPGYQQNIEFECRSGNQKWFETVEIKPKQKS